MNTPLGNTPEEQCVAEVMSALGRPAEPRVTEIKPVESGIQASFEGKKAQESEERPLVLRPGLLMVQSPMFYRPKRADFYPDPYSRLWCEPVFSFFTTGPTGPTGFTGPT